MSIITAGNLEIGDRFRCYGETWEHCGWCSMVDHVAVRSVRTGERRVISCHAPVGRVAEERMEMIFPSEEE